MAMSSERKSGGPPGPPVTRGRIPGALLPVVAVLLTAGCAVALYRMSPQRYANAAGCAGESG
jgi:hypothetical protein